MSYIRIIQSMMNVDHKNSILISVTSLSILFSYFIIGKTIFLLSFLSMFIFSVFFFSILFNITQGILNNK